MARIYLSTLYLRFACPQQRKLFRKTFGLSAEVNKENMKTAMKAGLYVLSASYYGRLGVRRRGRLDRDFTFPLYSEARASLLEEGYKHNVRSDKWELI